MANVVARIMPEKMSLLGRIHLRKVLTLKVNYHSDDIIMAVRRGLKHKVYRASEIENFLEVNAQKKNEINLFGKNRLENE